MNCAWYVLVSGWSGVVTPPPPPQGGDRHLTMAPPRAGKHLQRIVASARTLPQTLATAPHPIVAVTVISTCHFGAERMPRWIRGQGGFRERVQQRLVAEKRRQSCTRTSLRHVNR